MTIRENLLALRAVIERHNPSQFDLATYVLANRGLRDSGVPDSCGTIHCSLGAWTASPEGRAMGFRFGFEVPDGEPLEKVWMNTSPIVRYSQGWEHAHTSRTLDPIFGDEAVELFMMRGDHPADEQALAANPQITDQQLALARIDNQLKAYP